MLFRLGGLFILCTFGAFALRDVWPFSTFNSGAGLIATLTVYALLSYLTVRAYRRRTTQNASRRTAPLPPWPLTRTHRTAFLMLILLALVLGLVAHSTRSEPASTCLGAAAFAITGCTALIIPFYGIRFDYFPPGRGSGVSRAEDPAQFWTTLALFTLLGAAALGYGISNFLSVI